jgi:uncharacterized protein YkwD
VRAAQRHALLALSIALLSAALLASSLVAPAGAAATTTTREAKLLARISHARVKHGLPALQTTPKLMKYARQHSQDMAARAALFHTSNFGVICCWSRIGENIAYNATVRRVHRAFMHSPGHRANILDPRFRQVGVGNVKRDGVLWVTEVFTKPA